MDEWYSYGVFHYSRDEILWALYYREILGRGDYPPMPPEFMTYEYSKEDKKWVKVKRKSSYVDLGIKRRRTRPGANFEDAGCIIGEINKRLELTGRNGLHIDAKLLLAEVDAEYERFSDEAWTALNYISGWKRKKDYVGWKKQRRYRQKGGVMRFRRQDLTRIQVQERARRKKNGRR